MADASLSEDKCSSDESISSKSDNSPKKKSKHHKKTSLSHKSRRKEKKREKKKNKKKKKDKTKEKIKTKRHKNKSKCKSHSDQEDIGPELPPDLPDQSKKFAPMSKEEWDAKQKDVRRVLDEETGRYRLVRGTGEILEEIVSKERHKEINKQATMGDGAYFQSVISKKMEL